MISIVMNSQPVAGEPGETLLQVAQKAGVTIPTLCHHEALAPYGSCRLCLVEMKGGERPGLVASCITPIQEGLTVETHSARVIQARKLMVELLRARCPESDRLQELAEELGVGPPRFPAEEENCILCGLCVRACQKLDLHSIGFMSRGKKREIAAPFRRPSQVCVGCGVCANLCPVKTIEIEELAHQRVMKNWDTRLELQRCPSCGKYFTTERQILYLKGKVSLPEEVLNLCQSCRKRSLVKNLAGLSSR